VLRGTTHAQLLGSHMLLSRLLRIGLAISTEDEEEDALTAMHRLSALRFSSAGQRLELNARRALERQRPS
jgi:hypothetical protein